MTEESFVDSHDRLHSEMLRIWSRLLEIPDCSIDDDFFDKGGDSLLATELMLELRRLTGKALPDSLLFESSTIRSLAQRLSLGETPSRRAWSGSAPRQMARRRCFFSMATGRGEASMSSTLLESWDRNFRS